ncbi:MAG: T9SS C-terminal target domain-containing protein [Calditrichaeota bacterium]|nr:MAG: T9SS C-terminal target domain-containing protein [Calditrichota bacterium]
MRTASLFILIGFVSLIFAGGTSVKKSTPSFSQTTEILFWYAFPAGVELNAMSPTYRLAASVGQASIDTAAGSSERLYSGFWVPFPQALVLAVTEPAAGAQWMVNQMQTIRWQPVDSTARVDIELSRNGGARWEVLFNQIPNVGEQTWQVSMPRCDACLLRVGRVLSEPFAIVPEVVSSLVKPTPQPAGSEQTAYRLISVPGRPNNASPAQVLEDNLGTYDKTRWRFFDYQNGEFVEFGETRNFAPGRSFFLITRNGGNVDVGTTELVADSVFTLPLEPGWNLIANPYNFPIPVSALSVENQSFDLRTYTGDWSAPGSITMLQPWEGYALKVDDTGSYTLRIRPFQSGSAPAKQPKASAGGWSLRIEARCQQAVDAANFIGIRPEAREEFDAFDAYEPPPVGEFVALYVANLDWKERADRYSSDFRPPGGTLYRWSLESISMIEGEVTLSTSLEGPLPEGWEVWLHHRETRQVQNLSARPRYRFPNLAAGSMQHFQVLAGEAERIRQELVRLQAIPAAYQLYANYPNPFNPGTALRFALPEPQKVTLEVYDLLGQRVRILLKQNPLQAGYHTTYWDGRNERGEAVASGIYLYRLKAGPFVKTRRMILLK